MPPSFICSPPLMNAMLFLSVLSAIDALIFLMPALNSLSRSKFDADRRRGCAWKSPTLEMDMLTRA